MREFRILSIDGGGIRGLMPATFLAELEKVAKEPVFKYFDLICGTSTGSIIALAVSINRPMQDIATLYESKGPEIFFKDERDTFWGNISFYKNIIWGKGAIYDVTRLEKILKEEFSVKDKEIILKNAYTRVCIPSIDLTAGRIVVYKTPHLVYRPSKKMLVNDENKAMWQVARASSAAPIYFKSAKLENSYCIDGGMWANNPSLVGYIEALRCGYNHDEIKILSLGTGSCGYQVEENKAQCMNLKKWGLGKDLVQLSFEAQSEAIHKQLVLLVNHNSYLRLDCGFKEGIALDCISRLGDLKALGSTLWRDYHAEVEKVFLHDISHNPQYREEQI